MLSLPDDWDYSIEGLCKVNKEGIKAIKSTLQELKANDYLEVKKLYPNETESRHIEYEYCVFETPKMKNQEYHFVPLDNVSVENVSLQKERQINTNNKILKKESKKKKKSAKKKIDFENNSELENSDEFYDN